MDPSSRSSTTVICLGGAMPFRSIPPISGEVGLEIPMRLAMLADSAFRGRFSSGPRGGFLSDFENNSKALQCRTRTGSARGGVKENIVNQNVLKYVAK